MANPLRLEVHRITLEHKVKGKKGNRETYEKCDFKELLLKLDQDKQKAFAKFWVDLIGYFAGEYMINGAQDKAITVTANEKYSVASVNNVIDGEICGGPTNREQAVYKRKNAKTQISKVFDDDVVSSKFYVKLWMPYDYTSGVLMIQSYSNSNISDLVRDHLRKYVQKLGFRLVVSAYLPKEIQDKRSKASEVVSVTYIKDNISKAKSKLLNPIFAEYENLRIKVEISGFRKPFGEFCASFKNDGLALNTDIDALDMNKDDDDLNVIAKYKDADGRESTYNVDKQKLRDFAYIFLPEGINVEGKNVYDFEKIKKHTDSILNSIKKEINYLR